ncbi:TRAP transporter small permease [Occultella kanbiaonis]|uniref:TRAP transporter small permease n=1 Tax=Occultella kanbiaonis TaxID=2675754 RepID=UPI0012B6D246|nr:TRAP transporter small permease subunit [Occultella kanbiaonis]
MSKRTPDGDRIPKPDDTPDPDIAASNYGLAPAAGEDVPREPLLLRIWSGVELTIGVILFALIVIGVMYQVIGRYFPEIGWVGAGELALLSMIAMTFMTTGYLVGRNGHIVIEVFDQVLAGSRAFSVLRVVSALIMVATCLALAYEAFVKIEIEWARASAAMRVPIGTLYVFAFMGFLSAAIHSAWKIPYANRPERKLDISEMEG